MARRVFRILLILVLAALAGVTGWQAWSLDRTRTQQREAAALLQRDALRVTQAILDLRASQRAYLSPGQGIATWKSRVDTDLETLRQHFYALREQAADSVGPYAAAAAQADDEAMDALVALKFLERRIADHVTAGRIQHAADLVYADGVRISLTLERAANAAFLAHAQDLEAGRTRVQWTEGGLLGLAAAIGFVLAWLVIPGRHTRAQRDAATEAGAESATATADSVTTRAATGGATGAGDPAGAGARAGGKSGRRSEPVTSLGLAGSRGGVSAGASIPAAASGAGAGTAATAGRGNSPATPAGAGGARIAPATAAAAKASVLDDLPLQAPVGTYASTGGKGAPTSTALAVATDAGDAAAARLTAAAGSGGAPPVGPAAGISGMTVHTQEGLLAAAAELTVAVARVGDVDGLRPVLARLAEHLDAVGVIVWLEDASTQRLTPIVTHGYPAETLAHLPPIELDADNATARAWRFAELQIVASRNNQPGAIVVPMPSSAGCVGVISAEVRHGREHDPATLALARILAAQLAMLTGVRG